ncbi:retropepsin-like aspartic protease family protein [Novosphingobium sp. B 225]|uniref:retropepsin-like aspartic protease family protein n=1 Tax=Novosphingobium sp. B 225 TaxID=1961849 RepID=UPI000B4AF262|nr:TIGR02281 family clan AA aspartic protease [Novosphingobium sp. B 225]
MNRLYGIALGAVLLMMAVAGLLGRSDPAGAPAERSTEVAAAESQPSRPLPASALALKRDESGQFHLNGEVNGQGLRFLVDTGADTVALTEDSADIAGIVIEAGAFQPIMQTASGTGYGAPVVLDTLKLGESEFQNVDAVVVQGLGVNLLGQNVLRKMGKVTLQGDRMVIQPR